ncbi:MAG: nucleotidyltransferase domain-containing protein [Candidatus Hodarchaeales archaeon]|jgi:predicted nucleotidyltransferase
MPRQKVVKYVERDFHKYTRREKEIFSKLRSNSTTILRTLENKEIKAFIHGSVARGDVDNASDIDIHIPIPIPSFELDLIDLFKFAERRILMGTPNSTIRGVLSIHDNISISFPLSSPNEREEEFFRFSGLLYLDDIISNRRTPGVNKKLLLIEPEGDGYWISSINQNNKRNLCRILSLSQRIIDERIRVLTKRDKIGRTGLLLDYSLSSDENFEQALNRIADRNIIVRRVLSRK